MGSLRQLLCHVSFSSLLLLLVSQKAMCLDIGKNDNVYSHEVQSSENQARIDFVLTFQQYLHTFHISVFIIILLVDHYFLSI